MIVSNLALAIANVREVWILRVATSTDPKGKDAKILLVPPLSGCQHDP